MTNPRPTTPNNDAQRNAQPAQSLVERLGTVADNLRQLYTDFGLRPYEVFSVVVRWTGGSRHRGVAQVVSETPFLPTPKVEQVASVELAARAGGVVQRGTVRLSELSPRYTEDDIRVLFPRELLAGEEHFIEMRVDARDGSTARKRYVVSGTPERRPGDFDWTVRLTKQDEDRTRTGGLR